MSHTIYFTGYKMHPKRYSSYFPKISFVYNPSINEPINTNIVITHSVGIISALIYCSETKQKPSIIALDPPDISIDAIKAKINTLDTDLKYIYEKYLNSFIKVTDYDVNVYRNIKNKSYMDNNFYKFMNYYDEDTHYPYTIKKIRDAITKKLKRIND